MTAQAEIATTSAATGVAAAWAAAKGVALELFGVPLPVVLAAATAAFAARSFLPPTTYTRALIGGMIWTLLASFLANFASALAGVWLEKGLSAGALAGVALLIAGLGQFIAPVIIQKLPTAIGRRIDQLGGSHDTRGSE